MQSLISSVPWPRVVSAVIFGVLLSARLLQGSGPAVRFDPTNPEIGPFPTDALTVHADMHKTGVRVALPMPDCQAEPSTCAEIGLINELDGFNLYPRLKIAFTSSIDPDTLRSGVFVVWLENLTNEESGMRPAGHVTRIDRVLYDPSGKAFAKPDQVLDQHRRYALIVTNAIRGASGDPVEASPEFVACIARPDGYCGQLGRVLESLRSRFEPNQIVAASLFTTLSATAWMEKARDLLASTSPAFQPVSPKSVFSFSQIASISYQMQTKATPSQFTATPLNLTYMQGVGRVAFGTFRSPNFLNDQMVIPATPFLVDLALPAELKEVPFVVFLPDRPAPPGGYPVVILGHGSDMFDMQIGNAFAEGMAAYGLAVIAINIPGYGGGPASYVLLKDAAGDTSTVPHPGRAVDLDGNGTYDSGEGCKLFAGSLPVGVRDCYRQTAIDLLQMTRMIKGGVDLDGDGAVDLDPARVYFSGISLGGGLGTLFTALSPDIQAAALISMGASWTQVRTWGVANRSQALTMLGSRVPSLLNVKSDFDADSVLFNKPAHVVSVPGAVAIQEYFERIEWLCMPGDQLAYAPHLGWSTLPGVPAKRVLFQFGKGDLRAVNPTETALVLAANMQQTTSFYRHDLSREIWPDLNPDGHLYMFKNLPAAYGGTNRFGQWLIASLALQQQAGFLASGGTVIPNVNVFTQLWFGKTLFETPPEKLPEEINVQP